MGKATNEATSPDLKSSLERIGAWLAEHRPAYFADLGKPITARAAAQLPTDLQTLFSWHDGQSDDGSASFLGPIWLIPTEQMEHQRQTNAQTAKDIGKPEWWNDAWYPFADDSEGNLYCVHAEDQTVIFYEHDNSARNVIAPSLAAFFGAIAEGLDTEVIGLDPDDDEAGCLPRDDEEWTELYTRFGLTDPLVYAP